MWSSHRLFRGSAALAVVTARDLAFLLFKVIPAEASPDAETPAESLLQLQLVKRCLCNNIISIQASMAFAQPAVKDNFLYNGDLFVDVGNLNRHKRASVAEITEVLRPDLKKSKNTAAVKDPVGHWYEAQLIHYGLPPSKDKARAKMRLLENLNQSKLKVPPHITAIESELKKDFTAAERKAKAQYKASLAPTPSTQKDGPSTKKRK
ncbi:MAG: hypothetical protein Q9226_003815, partial [Calogaya cf. arnoldii]